MMSVEVRQELRQQGNVGFQADPLANLDEVFSADPAELRIVQQKIRELTALLHQVDIRQSVYALAEARNAQKIAQHVPRIVETERLVEVAE
jgi:hypothetical protein